MKKGSDWFVNDRMKILGEKFTGLDFFEKYISWKVKKGAIHQVTVI